MGRLPNAILEYLWVKSLWKGGARTFRDISNPISELVSAGEPPADLNVGLEIDQFGAWQAMGVNIVSVADGRYPGLLRELPFPPPFLFSRGNTQLLERDRFVAVVGSRNCDQLGVRLAHDIGEGLARAGVVVVSGLALGIDGAAHEGALSGALESTVAILGNGVDAVYPKKHHKLGQDILDSGGLILSQFEPGTPPYPANFLERNHLIAGLSTHTVVIQAAERSGALVTARLAAEYGRDVLAIPGAVNDPRHGGTNRLIRSGACLVTGVGDVLEELGVRISAKTSIDVPEAEAILGLLRQRGEMGLEDLKNAANIEDFHSTLLTLEAEGLVLVLPGDKVAVSNL
jgi:DNA processing protein